MLKTSDFDYNLPAELIAQEPLERRDASRLLLLNKEDNQLEHRHFSDLGDYLRPGDVLVANNSRVIPARLYGHKRITGGKVEILLLERVSIRRWRTLVGGKKIVPGTEIQLDDKEGKPTELEAIIESDQGGPLREIRFSQPLDEQTLQMLGHTPLPPYIHKTLEDPERYQTIYSRPIGSSAAPTAGLHFTPEMLLSLREMGVAFVNLTLHVGLDTFKPVESTFVTGHVIHSEWASLLPEAAKRINEAKLAGNRVIAIGTTSVRVLETAALRSAGLTGSLSNISERDSSGETTDFCPWRPVTAFEGYTDLYIYPGYQFRAVDMMITNFHLPQSSLLMLVSAFANQQQILDAYHTAIRERYRFYSFGDAMLIR